MAFTPLIAIPVTERSAEAGVGMGRARYSGAGRAAFALLRNLASAGTLPSSVDVIRRADGRLLIATVRGALDAAIAPSLRELLLRLVHASEGRLIVDLSAVTSADVNGLTVLVGTGRRASLLGGLLGLAGPSAPVVSLLAATGLDRQLSVFPSMEAAVAGVGSR